MARLVGIDIRASHVRAVLLRTSYKKVTIEQLHEIDVSVVPSHDDALRAVVLPLAQHSESLAVAVEGDQSFIHRIPLPKTALKQLDEVLPFEVEAQIPVDIDELVYDSRVLRARPGEETVVVVAAAARTEHVRSRIAQLSRVTGREPERVGVGPLPLANLSQLSAELAAAGPIAIVDLGGTRTEVVLLVEGEPVFARTLSRGVAGLPDSAPALAAELRQTFMAWLGTGGAPVEVVHLVGGGASAPGAESYLAHELGIAVRGMPPLEVEQLTPDQREALPRFAKAIALALSLSGRSRDLDLRTGPLAYQRGYGFLKEKIPLLTGLGVAITISFAFSAWAELSALGRDEEVLTGALASLSKSMLGQETTDPEEALALLERAKGVDEQDPKPLMDAYDVIVEISKAVPMSMTHDIEELDMQRSHVKLNGVVGSTQDAQQVASTLKEVKCFDDVKISKITQVINSDRQKYVLEFDVRCPDEGAKKKAKDKDKDKGEPAPETGE